MSEGEAQGGKQSGGIGDMSRILAEIQLLVENITSSLNKSLPEIKGLGDGDGLAVQPCDWLDLCCQLREKPRAELTSRDCAKLYIIRDALNQCAFPANALSIAYTAVVVRSGKDSAETAPCKLAAIAFPNLEVGAAKAHWWIAKLLPALMAIFLVFTLTLSFDTARGVSFAEQVVKLEKSSNEKPSQSDVRNQLVHAQFNLREWARANSFLYVVSAKPWQPVVKNGENPYNIPQAVTLISVLTTLLLPAFYGALGSMAGQVRDMYQRIKQNSLMPRHVELFFTPWLLGSVIGATIGLIFVPDGSTGKTDDVQGLTASLALTPSAISFLAGFGAEAVFDQLDSLVKRIFNIPGNLSTTPPTGR